MVLLTMPSSRVLKGLLYLGAVVAVLEMTATLLSVSRISSELAETKLALARAEERRSASPMPPALPPPLTATAHIVEVAPIVAVEAGQHSLPVTVHLKGAAGGPKTLLAETASAEVLAKNTAVRAEQDAKEATWERLRLEAGEPSSLETGKHHNAAPYPGEMTLDDNGAILEDEERAGDEDEQEEDIGPPMMDLLWTVLNPPEHNMLRTVPPDSEPPKDVANVLPSTELYDALELDADVANFTVLDFGSRDGGMSLKVARKHPTATVVSVALSGDSQEESESRKNETDFQLWLAAELGATNNLVCQPPRSTTPAMLLWWLYRQPVFFDYAVLSAHAMEILIEDLLPHELEAVMARAIQLARVVVVEEPDTSSARKYLRHWGDEKLEGLVKASAVLAKATDLSVHTHGDRTVRAKATFCRTVCLPRDVSGTGLFVAEGQPRLDDDFQDEIDRCVINQDETCVLNYDRNSETEEVRVTMKNGTVCPDDRRDLHISVQSVLQLGLGDEQRRALLSSALRVDITPDAVVGLAEQYQRTAAAVFLQGSVAFVNKWFEIEMSSDAAAESGEETADSNGGAGTESSGCGIDSEHVQSVAVGSSDDNDAKFTIEHTADAGIAAALRCTDCECNAENQCKHSIFGDTWQLQMETQDPSTVVFVVHRVDKDEGWGYDGLSIEYTVCESLPRGNGEDGRRRLQDWSLSDGGWQPPSEEDESSPKEDESGEAPNPDGDSDDTGEGDTGEEVEEETTTKSVALHLTGDDVSCEDEFDGVWPLIRRHTKFDAAQHPSVLLYGNDHITGLLAAKMARKMPTGSVVAMAMTQTALDAHSTMLNALDIDNAMLCHPSGQADDLDPFIGPLVQTPLQLSVQYIGSDIFGYALTYSTDQFVGLVGKALSLSATTYLEIPNPQVLGAWLNMLSRNEEADSFLSRHPYLGDSTSTEQSDKDVVDWIIGLCTAFVTAGGMEAEKVKIDVLNAPLWGQQQRLVRIDHAGSIVHRSISRPGHERDLLSFSLQHGLWVESQTPVLGGPAVSFAVQSEFMLSDLLELGLLNGYKDSLFVEYLDIAGLGLVDTAETLPKPSALSVRCAKLTSALRYMTESQLADFCTGEIGLEDLADTGGHEASNANWRNAMNLPAANFSLLTYSHDDPGLGGEQIRAAAMDLAARHPRSSVVSIMPHVGDFTKQLEAKGILNVLPIRNHMDKDLVGRIYRSPEFFQYQMMGNIIHFMHSMGQSDFSDFMEKVLSICSTTFFSMPSAELLSAATSLFYGIPPGTFKYAEKKLLLESVHDSHHLQSVAMAVHRLSSGSSIVKVETHNMTRTVHHHFDYEIDGHQRTYRMHSTGPHNVWMNREEDDSKIPYTVNGSPLHFGLTLISILRLGVTDATRDKLYQSFLDMPLYEDMAPWNIFFEAGKLIYIDYDTRNLHFDEAVPMAYQVIEVLMNYKRTVQDFQRCDSHATTHGWLPKDKTSHISECVSSSFDGPCDDPGHPVPCGDKTCHSTYVSCLKSIYALEMKEKEKTADKPDQYTAIDSSLTIERYAEHSV